MDGPTDAQDEVPMDDLRSITQVIKHLLGTENCSKKFGSW
jgi:hypothetical protein